MNMYKIQVFLTEYGVNIELKYHAAGNIEYKG
jgi:hypothetical protein